MVSRIEVPLCHRLHELIWVDLKLIPFTRQIAALNDTDLLPDIYGVTWEQCFRVKVPLHYVIWDRPWRPRWAHRVRNEKRVPAAQGEDGPDGLRQAHLLHKKNKGCGFQIEKLLRRGQIVYSHRVDRIVWQRDTRCWRKVVDDLDCLLDSRHTAGAEVLQERRV